ncbi:MAG: NAD(+) synthase [Nitrospirae bacterium]|nr:NAD(+) synthase [Nitrospirota bacterium]
MSIFGQKFNFIRVACASPEIRVADVDFNGSQILTAMDVATSRGASIILFPELSLTGSTCADLFTQSLLLEKVLDAVQALAADTAKSSIYVIVGLPISFHGRLYNCAALLGEGRILGIVPKIYLPTRGEFYEGRWFTSGVCLATTELMIGDQGVPFGKNLLFMAKDNPCCILGVEICEDLWAVEPPSGGKALAGGTIILNPSASNELLGKSTYRRDLVKSQSARCLAGYGYASSGPGESSTDVVCSGHCMVAENGTILAESERFHFDTQIIYADIDLNRLHHERLCHTSFSEGVSSQGFQYIACSNLGRWPSPEPIDLLRPNSPTPFVPSDPDERASTCREIFSIQSTGLAKRLKHLGATRVVLGVSGGLDSTLALLATAHAFDVLKLERRGILAVTMPGLGTSLGTKSNAEDLARLLHVELRVIPIHSAVRQHFKDIGHDPNILDVTFENAQARERTQILMDLANKIGGLVVGTGDLSEAALGWCTFNGDHMSMYHVNIGVPKTLVRFMIEWCADEEFTGEITTVLRNICSTPISPELLPVGKDGELKQQTEELVGPYELHDYFLFQMVRHGHSPSKILYLAELAFENRYDRTTILRWLEVFIIRFFTQQFKRSSMPDGPKVGSVALSPRGDWRMPSDASAETWLTEIRSMQEEIV